jgi:delta 1-pyrroline-5-carboxylate dehydrogenase
MSLSGTSLLSAGVESVSVTTRRAGDITDVRRGGLMSDTVTDVKACQWYAGGQWRDVSGGKLFDDFEPRTGNLYARVAQCDAGEARLAITAADEAFGPWADLSPAENARLFFKAAEIVRRRRPEIANLASAGSPS